MKKDMQIYIDDILESINKIEDYTRSVDEKEFYGNTQIQDAVLRRIEIIGEAVKNITPEFREKQSPGT